MSQARQYEMKDSGMEWIGMKPSNWSKRRIKTLLKVLRGGSPRPIEAYLTDSPDGVNWIKIGDTTKGVKQIFSTRQKIKPSGVAKSRMVHKGDLLLTNSMSFGEPYFLETDGCIHDGWVCLTQLSGIDKLFLYYFLRSDLCMTQFRLQVDGGVVQNLNIDKIGETFVFLPPLPEQETIAAYLDGKCAVIDDIIAEAKASIDDYKAWKASVIFEAVTKGLDPNTEMKDSGVEWIGKIPKGWHSERFKFVLRQPLQYGANSAGVEYKDDLPRYIRITDITNDNRLSFDNMLSLPDGEASGYLLDDKDILLARSGATAGKAFLWHSQYGEAAFAGYLIRAKVNSQIVLPEYAFYSMLGSGYEQWKSYIAIQATIPNIGANKYNEYILPVPSLTEQATIVAYLDKKCAAIDGIIAEKESLIAELETYKKSLIFETVTGKRRVC